MTTERAPPTGAALAEAQPHRRRGRLFALRGGGMCPERGGVDRQRQADRGAGARQLDLRLLRAERRSYCAARSRYVDRAERPGGRGPAPTHALAESPSSSNLAKLPP